MTRGRPRGASERSWSMSAMSGDAHVRDGGPLVLVGREDGVTWLTLNRGDRFNLLSSEMITALEAALDDAASDASVHAIVLAANGRGFCAGHDLKEMRARAGDKAWQRRLFDDCSRMMTKFTRMPPVSYTHLRAHETRHDLVCR